MLLILGMIDEIANIRNRWRNLKMVLLIWKTALKWIVKHKKGYKNREKTLMRLSISTVLV